MVTRTKTIVGAKLVMPHLLKVDIGALRLWFSYETCVAFQDEDGRRCSENAWGAATGRHLSAVCADKAARIDRKTFEASVDSCLAKHGLSGSLPDLPAAPAVSAMALRIAQQVKTQRGRMSTESLAKVIDSSLAKTGMK